MHIEFWKKKERRDCESSAGQRRDEVRNWPKAKRIPSHLSIQWMFRTVSAVQSYFNELNLIKLNKRASTQTFFGITYNIKKELVDLNIFWIVWELTEWWIIARTDGQITIQFHPIQMKWVEKWKIVFISFFPLFSFFLPFCTYKNVCILYYFPSSVQSKLYLLLIFSLTANCAMGLWYFFFHFILP